MIDKTQLIYVGNYSMHHIKKMGHIQKTDLERGVLHAFQ